MAPRSFCGQIQVLQLLPPHQLVAQGAALLCANRPFRGLTTDILAPASSDKRGPPDTVLMLMHDVPYQRRAIRKTDTEPVADRDPGTVLDNADQDLGQPQLAMRRERIRTQRGLDPDLSAESDIECRCIVKRPSSELYTMRHRSRCGEGQRPGPHQRGALCTPRRRR